MAGSKNIIIAGAGIAGLTAAYRLERQGFNTTVIEAANSAGGRIRTLREPFDDGLYAEAGAMAITSNDTHLLALLNELELPLIPISDRFRKARYRADNRWHDINEPSSARILPDSLKHLSVSELLQHYINKYKIDKHKAENDKTDTIEHSQLKSTLDCSSLSPDLLALDQLSLADFLRQKGASECEIYLIANFINTALLSRGIEHISALQHLIQTEQRHNTETFTVADGNDQIIHKLLEKLQTPPLTNSSVTAIEQTCSGINVTYLTAGNEELTLQGDALICTIPLPVIQHVSFTPALPEDKQTAIRVLGNSYPSVARVFLQCSPQPQLQTSESAQAIIDLPAMQIEDHTFHLKNTAHAVLETHTFGDQAREVANMPLNKCLTYNKKLLEEIFPDTQASLHKSTVVLWDKEPHHHGAYLSFRPGEMQYLSVISRTEGQIYFAGEHTSMLPGSMEGAVCSAENIVRKILL